MFRVVFCVPRFLHVFLKVMLFLKNIIYLKFFSPFPE
jgi:hypothetical protein